MPPRFFCRTPLPRQHFPQVIALDDDCARHVRVLRLAEGDVITLFDGVTDQTTKAGEATAVIKTIDKRSMAVEITAWHEVQRESGLDVALIQSLATGDKMDLIIQKAVELGVTEVVPLRTSRSTLKLDAERAEKRLVHWRGVAIAACEQCGRNVVPPVTKIHSIEELLITPLSRRTPGSRGGQVIENTKGLDSGLRRNDEICGFLEVAIDQTQALTRCLGILHPESGADRRVSLLAWAQANAGKPLGILVGPEGGFSDVEIAAAVAKGATLVTLGPRVLRTETAGLAALAILQSTLGDLG